mgnify:CR=1 FL=1
MTQRLLELGRMLERLLKGTDNITATGAVDQEFGLYFVRFWAAGPVPEAWKPPEDSWGLILRFR